MAEITGISREDEIDPGVILELLNLRQRLMLRKIQQALVLIA